MVIVAHMIDHSYGNLPMAVADLGEVPRGLGPPLFLDQAEARRVPKKIFLETAPPYLRVWMTGPPPYLKVWIRHCTGHFG